MTSEHVFRLYRAYKFFYGSKDTEFRKFLGIQLPDLQSQRDKTFYHRISQKLNDQTIHALFTWGFFFHPNAHVSMLATPEAFQHAMVFASRQQNGDTQLVHDFYELRKRLNYDTLDTWLYGEMLPDGTRAAMPECLQDLIRGDIALDFACLLLLIPQTALHFNWVADMELESDDSDLGSAPWIHRLHRADMLIRFQRPMWRADSRRLSTEFWQGMALPSLAPKSPKSLESALW